MGLVSWIRNMIPMLMAVLNSCQTLQKCVLRQLKVKRQTHLMISMIFYRSPKGARFVAHCHGKREQPILHDSWGKRGSAHSQIAQEYYSDAHGCVKTLSNPQKTVPMQLLMKRQIPPIIFWDSLQDPKRGSFRRTPSQENAAAGFHHSWSTRGGGLSPNRSGILFRCP